MHINLIRSDQVYQDLLNLSLEKREGCFRARLLAPFAPKYQRQHIPLKAKQAGGFDAMTLLGFMNQMPGNLTEKDRPAVEAISSDRLWQDCQETIQRAIGLFEQAGYNLEVQDYHFTILLGNPESRMLQLNQGYSGDGGIPGYLMLSLLPNDYTLPRMQAALAHECNHNVRFQFIKWNQQTTLADWIVSEGLAESFAAELYGEELIGPWVTSTSPEQLEEIKPIISSQLQLTGMMEMSPYLYGDEIAELQGQLPVGLPYAAGYAYGYHLIQAYLKKTGKSIIEATVTPTEEILEATKDFWK
ncbi:hypothetical protein STRDD11_00285 [Streptococcus sp. DD11]|uniref:DUF2268 domain-containing protein n=1 Tax=Streptococcus sp. DD11 TaxID=1777879 RepID=UPI000794C5EC|nr:DUF2268 domain-containing protein [Streptococcus sp. DD11]KXT85647.1 hypothetical protein STRDD11_00285 [Streptococcus sp. DD11]